MMELGQQLVDKMAFPAIGGKVKMKKFPHRKDGLAIGFKSFS